MLNLSLQEILAKDKDLLVRMAMADNQTTSPDILHYMAMHNYNEDLLSTIASNKNCSEVTLQKVEGFPIFN